MICMVVGEDVAVFKAATKSGAPVIKCLTCRSVKCNHIQILNEHLDMAIDDTSVSFKTFVYKPLQERSTYFTDCYSTQKISVDTITHQQRTDVQILSPEYLGTSCSCESPWITQEVKRSLFTKYKTFPLITGKHFAVHSNTHNTFC